MYMILFKLIARIPRNIPIETENESFFLTKCQTQYKIDKKNKKLKKISDNVMFNLIISVKKSSSKFSKNDIVYNMNIIKIVGNKNILIKLLFFNNILLLAIFASFNLTVLNFLLKKL